MRFLIVGKTPITNYSQDIIMTQKKAIRSSEKNQNISLDDSSVVFTTYDLGVSAALLCAGFELFSLKKENPRKALFVFKRADGIDDVANQYFTDQLKVKARSFFDNIKALKNKLYSE